MAVGLTTYLIVVSVIPVIGAFAGWLAGKIVDGHGFGAWSNAAVGVLGSIVGSFVFGFMGLQFFGLTGIVIKAAIGAVIAMAIANWFKTKQAG